MIGQTDRPAAASMAPLAQSSYRIALSLSIADASALWAAAFAKGMDTPGVSHDDVVDLIGPAEDPDLSACITLLAVPAAIAGCDLHDFELVELHTAPSPANDLDAQERVGASA